ncbi:MAG: hypothetical protein JWO99_731 [Candidatus Saccharibacteria bacterium]|nr:hypothetical protein [Candidatus Saccharibacteria bacterium]
MHRKLFVASLRLSILIGTLFILQPAVSVSAEYACGTYGSSDYSTDCNDADTGTAPSTETVSNKGGTASNATPSSVATPTAITLSPPPATTNITTPAVVNHTPSQAYAWWPWAVCGALVIAGLILVARMLNRNQSRKQK